MILAYINQPTDTENLLLSAYYLAEKFVKIFGIVVFETDKMANAKRTKEIEDILLKYNLPEAPISFISKNDSIVDYCESHEVSLLLIQQHQTDKKSLIGHLKECKGLRIPYLLYKSSFPVLNLSKIIVPVSYLVEEYEKAQFASAFGRFCKSNIRILQANDYGSKAATTVDKMSTLFDKFNLNYTIQKAKSDSYKVDKEAVQIAKEQKLDLILISASREYGLDDIVFGPREYLLVKKSIIPILLINPRSDLYTLCD